jgi:hypothetical protein
MPSLDQMLSALNERVGPAPHWHCMRPYEGVLHMVVPNGHVVVKCCECPHMETRHMAHVVGMWS